MKKSRFVEYLEYIPARIIFFALRIIPYRLAVSAGALFGMLVYVLAPGQRKIVRRNLQIAFKNTLSSGEAGKLSRRVFRNVGKTAFEFMQFPKLDAAKMRRIARQENYEALEKAQAEGRGVIVITGHIGNWEMLAARSADCGARPLYAIVRLLDNTLLDVYVERLRENKGVRVIPRGHSLRRGIKALKKGYIVCFVMDQNAARNGIFVPFFETPASTVQGPAVLAMRYKAPVVLCYDRRTDDNTHVCTYEEPIPFVEGRDEAETIALNTARYTAAIEAVIKKYPDQWLWLHPRWKLRPDGEEMLYP